MCCYAEEAGLSFEDERLEQEEAKVWVIDLHLDRRSLTAYARGDLIDERQDILFKNQSGRRTDLESTSVPIGTEVPKDREWPTRKAASAAGIGHNTYNKIKYLKQNAPELADDIFVLEKLEQEEKERPQTCQAILWIIDHQLDRRNISLYSRGRLINRKRAELSKGQGYRSDIYELPQNSGEVAQVNDRRSRETDRKLAKESGISHNTLSRIAKIYLAFEDETLEKEEAKERQGQRNDLKEGNICKPVYESSDHGRTLGSREPGVVKKRLVRL